MKLGEMIKIGLLNDVDMKLSQNDQDSQSYFKDPMLLNDICSQ